MKNHRSRFLNPHWCLPLWTTLLMISSCAKKEPEIVPDNLLMKEFSQSPPLIQDVSFQKLEKADEQGNTVLVMVTFAKDETRLKGINSIPLSVDENLKLKLNDRGISSDQKANDGIFSVSVQATDEELNNLVNQNNEVLQRQKNRVVSLIGRRSTVREVSQIKFGLKDRIPLELFSISAVTGTTLPDIRSKSLMITDVSVVEDLGRTYDPCRTPNKGTPDGAWSFKTLITNMSGSFTAEQFLIDWVDNFLFSLHSLPSTDATTNRTLSKEKLIKAWMQNSGVTVADVPGIPANWQTTALKAEEFPVRLLAIVNRLDLRGNSGYGGFNNAGEGRFVFCFVDSRSDCNNGGNEAGTMTFILEYGIPINSCQGLKDYGKRWWDLQAMSFGPAFNDSLEAITKVFSDKDANLMKPNGSALNHFRTNDFLQSPWVIRDFEIDSASQKLKIVHPNKEPMESSNGFGLAPISATKLAALVAFVNLLPITPTNLNPPYTIPEDLKGIHAPIRGAQPVLYHWKGAVDNPIDSLKRREFSFNTCSGCHKGETKNSFTHIRPRAVGVAAELSGFMTGLGVDDNSTDDDNDVFGDFWVNDPGPTPLPQRGFNDARTRALSLEDLVFNSPCIIRPKFPRQLMAIDRILRFRPINMSH